MQTMFQSYSLGKFTLKNRIIMPPLVTRWFDTADGVPNEDIMQHYEARAAGGVSMIIVEASCVEAEGKLVETQLGLWTAAQGEAHKRLVDRLRPFEIPVIAQIHHAGPCSVTGPKVGPTAGRFSVYGVERDVEELSLEDIARLRRSFLNAALMAKDCGYDGVEIHCCHAYLLCAFLSPVSNQRTDAYGGSLENRMRLPLEILQDIRAACGPEFLISVRMGYDIPDINGAIEVAKRFRENGADLLHISTGWGSAGMMDERIMPPAPDGSGLNIRVWGAGQIKQHVDCPVIAVGGVREPWQAEKILSDGYADLVAVGRGLLCDPEWVNSASSGKKIATCYNCKLCLWGRDHYKCPVVFQAQKQVSE